MDEREFQKRVARMLKEQNAAIQAKALSLFRSGGIDKGMDAAPKICLYVALKDIAENNVRPLTVEYRKIAKTLEKM